MNTNLATPLHAATPGSLHVRAGFIPPGFTGEVDWARLAFGEVTVQVPSPSAEQLQALAAHVRAHQVLKQRSVHDIVALIDRLIHRLLDRDNPQRQLLDGLLARITGMDEEMLRLGLGRYLQRFRAPQLLRFLVEDLGNPGLLDRFEPRAKGGLSMAVGPDVLVHVWAGNVPGLPLWSLVAGLLVKSNHLCKLPSAEPLVASLFAALLAQESPELAQGLAVVWWPGGDTQREQVVMGCADVVLAYGGNEALSDLRAHVPISTRYLAFGHKLSFAMVSRQALDARRVHEVARATALDVMRFEQQGCYSPQLVYVERAGRCSPSDFAHHLQQQLRALAKQYPRRALSLEERQAMATWRHAQEQAAFASPHVQLLGDAADPFAVVLSDAPGTSPEGLMPSALNRTVRVVAVDALMDVVPGLAPHRALLQTVGLAASPGDLLALSQALAYAGVTRICAMGEMTLPEAGWHHDGRCSLADLVQMVDIELGAERAADDLAPYVD